MSQEFKKTLIVIIAVVGVALIGIVAYEYKASPRNITNRTNYPVTASKNNVEVELPKPTGKIDDVISAAIAGVEAEANVLSNEELQAQNALDDSSEVSEFGQSYDENEIQ